MSASARGIFRSLQSFNYRVWAAGALTFGVGCALAALAPNLALFSVALVVIGIGALSGFAAALVAVRAMRRRTAVSASSFLP